MASFDFFAPISVSARLYSVGNTLTNCRRAESQFSSSDFARGEPVNDDDFLLLLNAHHDAVPFTVPNGGAAWQLEVDTALDAARSGGGAVAAAPAPVPSSYPLEGRSLVLLRRAAEAP